MDIIKTDRFPTSDPGGDFNKLNSQCWRYYFYK